MRFATNTTLWSIKNNGVGIEKQERCMKKVFYFIYALMFNIFSIFPLKSNKIVFLSPHNENFNDSLGAVMEEIIRRDKFRIVLISGTDLKFKRSDIFGSIGKALSFFTVKAYHLATAKFVFMNDNFMPMGKLQMPLLLRFGTPRAHLKSSGLILSSPRMSERLKKRVTRS